MENYFYTKCDTSSYIYRLSMQGLGKPLSYLETNIKEKAVEDIYMNLSYSQFHNVTNPPEKTTSGCKSQAPVVSQYLNMAIKQERLRKLQAQNKRLKETNG